MPIRKQEPIPQRRLLAVLTLAAASVWAQGLAVAPDEDVFVLEAFEVIGSRESVFTLPGSADYIGVEELDQFYFEDINRALRMTPGVYLREEDGYGLFPNISLRGADSNRSAKLTLMEDGVLTAPAPYSAPSAYYSPTAGRMAGLEVLKGSSQIKYGPHTTGGAVNYISTAIPETEALSGQLMASYGTDNAITTHDYAGQTVATDYGQFGYLLEVFHQRADGFKTIDNAGNLTDPDATGFEKTDYMAKLGWTPDWEKPHYFEFKIGYTDFDADETYLGLSTEDFREDPYRRYAASRLDHIDTEHVRTYLRHHFEINADTALTTTAYYNKFARNWYKVNNVQDVDDLDDDGNTGDTVALSRAIAAGGGSLDILRGDADGFFNVRANNRSYELYGVQTELQHAFATGGWEHVLELGARWHYDHVRRFQRDDRVVQVGGDITVNPGVDGGAGNRRQETVAVALYAEDTISAGAWTFKPGIRYETLDLSFENFTNGDDRDGSLDVFAPGLGVTYAVDDGLLLFGGYHRGYSTPGPGGATGSAQLMEETSDSVELGGRYRKASFYTEAVFFYTHLSDLIVNDSIAAGGADENVGEIETFGLELLAEFDVGHALELGYGVPVSAAFTWTDATLDGDSTSEDAESQFAGGADGNRVPYVPEWQLTLSAGLEFEKLRTYVSASFVGESFSSATETSDEVNPNLGAGEDPADARFGGIDDFVIVDWSAHYALRGDLDVFVKVNNVFEEEYISSRHPHGVRPGAPRMASVGFKFAF